MIISENHFGKENCVAYCDVLIRRNYEVINADEHFYHFVEKLVGINFLDIVHQDNLKDFKMAFETIKPGENCRMLILRWNLSRGFSAKHNVSENSVQNICRAVSPQRMRIIGSMVFFYL